MLEYLNRLLDILVLRRGPQDLPGHPVSLVLSLLLYTAVAAISLHASPPAAKPPAGLLWLFLALPLALIWLVMWLAGRPHRYVQTAAALFGVGALLALVNVPLALSGPQPTAIAVLLGVIAFFWHFVVDTHVWRHALEISIPAALTLTVLLFAIGWLAVWYLFPTL